MSKNLVKILTDKLNSGELLEVVDNSLASTQVLAKLGFSNKGQYIIIVREFLVSNDVDISHWTINGKPKAAITTKQCPVCISSFYTRKGDNEEQLTCSVGCSNTYFRSGIDNPNWLDNATKSYRNKALKQYGCICNRCGFSVLAALVVHHKDKNRNNNVLENLEVLCANCHAIEHYTKINNEI